jgi:predicted AlkP superfamily pyrophosphatase or phosphodiesterase
MLHLLTTTLAAAALAVAPRSQDADGSPRLVVLVSVDQLATWVFEAARPHFAEDGGFARLLDQGVLFTNCAYAHGCTATGPGHATLGTGAPASVHGIVDNQWIDPITGAAVYCATTAGAEAVGGGSANRGPDTLKVPTLGEVLKAQRPGARVVGLSFKDRGAILPAGRGADAALYFDQGVGHFVTTTAYAPAVPAWVARFEAAYPLTRYFGRTWDRYGAPSAFEGLVDDRPFEGPDPNKSRTLPKTIDGGRKTLRPRFYSHLYASPFANEVLVDLARAAVDAYDLGEDDVPDLLTISFSSPDAVGHQYGPESHEVRDTLLRLDRDLEALLRTLDARVGRGRHLVLLSSDHGVGPCPEGRVAAGLAGGRDGNLSVKIRAAAEKTMRDAYGEPAEKSWVRGTAGTWLYLDRSNIEKAGIDRAEASQRVAKALEGLSTLHAAIPTTGPLPADLDPALADIFRSTYHPDSSGDVYFVYEPYWLGYPTPTASHGTPWAYDREVPLIAFGPGIRNGVVHPAAVTPGMAVSIAAAVLGIEPPLGATEVVPDGVFR